METYPTTSWKMKRTTRAGVFGTVFDLDLDEDGGPMLIQDSPELCQTVTLRLLMVRGEAWEAPGCGLPWHTLMGMRPPNTPFLHHEMLQELRKEDRIVQVDQLGIDSDEDLRHVAVTAYATTRDGSKVKVKV
jgi:hypothetical protein